MESEILSLKEIIGHVDEGNVIVSKPLELPLAKINDNNTAQKALMDIVFFNTSNRIDAKKAQMKSFY